MTPPGDVLGCLAALAPSRRDDRAGRRVVGAERDLVWIDDRAIAGGGRVAQRRADGRAALGVEGGVHPDGPDRHIERHLTLRRAGWELTDVFRSRWMLRTEDLAANLVTELSRPGLGSS